MTRKALVIGAGPAGSSTAIALARAGWDVTLFERRARVEQKVCGECLSPPSREALMKLGVWDAIPAARLLETRGIRLVSPRGERCLLDFGSDPALAIPRPVLDEALLEGARGAGARVLTGTTILSVARDGDDWVARGERESWRGQLVVAADGRHSRFARELGLAKEEDQIRWLKHAAVMVHYKTPAQRREVEMHVTPWGYVGLNPLPDSMLNVIAVLEPAELKRRLAGAGQGGLVPLLDELARGASATDSLRASLEGATRGEHALVVPSMAWVPTRVADPDRGVVLAGDSAGFVDPFTGEGLYHALTSALELGRLLAPQADVQGALREYAAWHGRVFGPEERFCLLLQRLLPRSRLADYVIGQLGRKPALARELAEAVADRQPVERILSPWFWARALLPWPLMSSSGREIT